MDDERVTMPMVRSEDDLLRFGLFYPCSPLSTMTPSLRSASPDVLDIATHVTIAQNCEEAGLDYIFMADRWETNGPLSRAAGISNPGTFGVTMAAMLVPVTTRIGITCTVHMNYFAP